MNTPISWIKAYVPELEVQPQEFVDKITKIINKTYPSCAEAAYVVAAERDIKIIGQELKTIYTKVRNTE